MLGGIVKENGEKVNWSGGMGVSIPNWANSESESKARDVFDAFSEVMKDNRAAALFIHFASKEAAHIEDEG